MIEAAAALPGPLLVAAGAIAGLIVGSFVGALIARWPRGESVVRGRSRCDACGRGLRVTDLVPVLSFLALRGRCRECGVGISADHLAAELACALVGATAFAAAPPTVAVAGAAFGWVLIALALLDATAFWLPDRLTLPLGIAGVLAAGAGLGVPLRDSLIGAAAGFGVLALIAVIYRLLRGRVGLGGGDPKLLGAIGAWLGWTMLPAVLLLASATGLLLVALRHVRGRPVSRSDALPLGTLMALAAWPLWLIRSAA
ncbi:MAG TPA: prepilin peptidase [Sphingomonadaceae bacterium]|jgi:leader peptidase (prepilin peptidase)/N-methyltransferase|nr:prepilin peptidase [Sphingomonadaceae bacterium]